MSNSAFSQNAPASSFADLTGVPDDNAALATALAGKANVADIPKRYKFHGDGGAATGTVVANTLGVTINVTNPSTGEYFFTAASGTPFTADKVTIVPTMIGSASVLMTSIEDTSTTVCKVFFFDNSGSPTDPSRYQVIIEVEP
jgi:tripartite-type tricarboxylate transporter receptor subunit TctC